MRDSVACTQPASAPTLWLSFLTTQVAFSPCSVSYDVNRREETLRVSPAVGYLKS